MTVKELKNILAEYGDKYDDCVVTCYEVCGTVGYANEATNAYVGKTYVNQGYPIRRTFQIQFEFPNRISNYIRENCPKL